jgi:selenocysteine-specific elongation factor
MKHIIVGTAGHIDHGKTALVKALTGIDADRLKEEQERGITIDIGFADLTLEEFRIGFVDVPGHERFVKNMLAGAHGLDLVMLVVAADESIMPQTREHFDICRMLQVKSGLVALTKSDLVDQELCELARAEVEDFVRGSFLEGAPIIPVSSRTGEGIDNLKKALGELAGMVELKRTAAVMRLPIDRAFSIKGFGTVVTGTLIAGELRIGEDVEVLPSGVRTRVRNIQVHGSDTDLALAGQRTAVNLQGLTLEQVARGSVLAPAARLRSTSMIDAQLDLLESAPRPLSQRARVRLHHGTAEVMARVVILAGDEEAADHGSETAIRPGNSGLVQLRLEESIVALPGDRFIIRSYSPQVTIGGGTVLDSLPEKHRIKEKSIREALRRLKDESLTQKAATLLEMAGTRALTASELAARIGATNEQIESIRHELVSSGQAIEVSAAPLILISTESGQSLAEKIVDVLKDHHHAEPLSLGLNREEVRERVFGNIRPEIFRAVVQLLTAAGKIAAQRDTLRLAAHEPELSESDSNAKDKLEENIRLARFQAGTLQEFAAASGIPPELARKLYNLLAAGNRVQRIGDFVFHSDSIEELKMLIRARKSISNKIDVAVFKEITGGLSRKHAIPLLEFLDREKITRRVGNDREIL